MGSNSKNYEGSFTSAKRKANKISLSLSLKDMIPDYSELFEAKKNSSKEEAAK